MTLVRSCFEEEGWGVGCWGGGGGEGVEKWRCMEPGGGEEGGGGGGRE